MYDETIVDKYGGMNNASVYIGLIPERKVGVVINITSTIDVSSSSQSSMPALRYDSVGSAHRGLICLVSRVRDVRRLQKAQGLAQNELADAVRIQTPVVSHIKNWSANPTLNTN